MVLKMSEFRDFVWYCTVLEKFLVGILWKTWKKYKKYYFGTRLDYLVTLEVVLCDRGRNIYFDTGRYIN